MEHMTNGDILKFHFDVKCDDFLAYKKLITEARNNPPEGYSEKHHVCPRSLGAKVTTGNLVRLKASDHFKAHFHLMNSATTDLAKDKMTMAFWLMHTDSKFTSGRSGDLEWVELVAETYAITRELYAKNQSEKMQGHWGSNETPDKKHASIIKAKATRIANGGYNFHTDEQREKISEANKKRFEDRTNVPAFGKQWIHNPSTGEKVRIPKDEAIPEGWLSGIGKRKERSDKGSSKPSPSEETKAKIARKVRENHANGVYDGVDFSKSDETKEKIREARRNQVISPEHLEKLRQGNVKAHQDGRHSGKGGWTWGAKAKIEVFQKDPLTNS